MNLLMIPACCPHPALVVRRRTTIQSAEARSPARRPASILDNAFFGDVGSDSTLPRPELESVALQPVVDHLSRSDTRAPCVRWLTGVCGRLRLAADGRDGLGRGRHGAGGAGQWAVGALAGTSTHQALPTLAELPTLERVGLRRLETLPDDYR